MSVELAPSLPMHRLASNFSKRFRRNLRDYGINRTIIKVIGSLCSLLFYTRAYVLYRMELDKIPAPAFEPDGFIVRYLAPDEGRLLAQIKGMEEWLEENLDPILKRGGRCLVALDGERIAGFNLVSFQQIHLPAVDFTRDLRPRVAYSEQITVEKSYRGRNVGTTLRRELFRSLRSQGIRKLYGGADINNQASLALSRKVGFVPIVTIRHVKFMGQKRQIIRRSHA